MSADSGSPYPSFAEISRNFAPGWFAAVMGTGVLSLTTLSLSRQWPVLECAAFGLHLFNLLLFLLLAVPWLTRWLRFPQAALATLNHPVQASFYPTFSIALLVLAAQGLAFGHDLALVLGLWWTGALLTYLFSFVILYRMFLGEHVALDHVTPAKFIPAVGLVVIPVAGGPLLEQLQGPARELALLANVLGLGAGSLMYLSLLGLMIFRKYLHKPALGVLTPTVWIQLAPIGVIPVSLMNLLAHFSLPGAMETAQVLALLLWGAGIWWLIMALLMTLAARSRGQLPFALSWWGFIFPLGALVTLSLRLAQVMPLAAAWWGGVLAWVLMLGLWALTLFKTLRGVVSGAVFRPH